MVYVKAPAFFALAGALLASSLSASASPIAADSVCPNATPYVQQYNDQSVNENTPVDDFMVTINKAIEAYDNCSSRMVTSGSGEGRHYAQMREAQFRVAQGRLLRLLERYDDARVSLQSAIALVKETIEWRSGGRAQSNSIYKEPSLTIKAAAQAELDKLPKPAASAAPAATPR
jgi:hypothetical protein